MSDAKKVEAARAVANDQELTEGVFRIGRKYLFTTPTWMYVGTLVAVTPMVYLVRNTSTVYETGGFPEFFAGRGQNVEPHTGSPEMVIDRAGVSLNLMPETK